MTRTIWLLLALAGCAASPSFPIPTATLVIRPWVERSQWSHPCGLSAQLEHATTTLAQYGIALEVRDALDWAGPAQLANAEQVTAELARLAEPGVYPVIFTGYVYESAGRARYREGAALGILAQTDTAVLVHELGHVLGLSHTEAGVTPEGPNPIMCAGCAHRVYFGAAEVTRMMQELN